jgi:hypothetical protein
MWQISPNIELSLIWQFCRALSPFGLPGQAIYGSDNKRLAGPVECTIADNAALGLIPAPRRGQPSVSILKRLVAQCPGRTAQCAPLGGALRGGARMVAGVPEEATRRADGLRRQTRHEVGFGDAGPWPSRPAASAPAIVASRVDLVTSVRIMDGDRRQR